MRAAICSPRSCWASSSAGSAPRGCSRSPQAARRPDATTAPDGRLARLAAPLPVSARGRDGALFALWPAGVAMASVVGTDVPAAALLALALALLVTLGPRRPGRRAGVRRGDGPGRLGARGGAAAVGAGARLLARAPAAAPPRGAADRRRRGRHAGRAVCPGASATCARAARSTSPTITAASPRSSAPTRTRRGRTRARSTACSRTSPDGASSTSRTTRPTAPPTPSRASGRASSRGYALGLATLKADRLFDPEHRLLYWSIFRPGVLVGRRAAWFAARRGAIAAVRRRVRPRRGGARARRHRRGAWRAGAGRLLALLPFQLALVGDLRRLLRGAALPPADRDAGVPVRRAGARRARGAAGRRWRARAVPASSTRRGRSGRRWCWSSSGGSAGPRCSTAARACGRATAGRSPRSSSTVARPLLWAPAPPLAPTSPLAGAPNGVHLVAAAAPPRAAARLGGRPTPRGNYLLSAAARARRGSGSRRGRRGRRRGNRRRRRCRGPGGPLTCPTERLRYGGGPLWIGAARAQHPRCG